MWSTKYAGIICGEFMIVIGVLYGAATGNLEAVTQAVLESAGEAVSICITMIGVMSLWVGLMQIAKEAGLIGKMTEAIRPAIHFMFPRIPAKHPALGIHFHQCDCQYSWIGMGGNAGWSESHGGVSGTGAEEAGKGNVIHKSDHCCQ